MARSRWLMAFLLVLCVAPAQLYASSEQIVFANTDNPNPGPSATGVFNYTFLNPEDKFFGFWVWCEDAEAGNPYAGECHGSLYFYGIALTKGVSGTLSEGPDGIYHMTVSSRDGKVSCTLWNASPVITRGLTNTVNAICAAPAGSGTSPHSVVQVTGH
ncbi:MAG: hypothetical protein E6H66_06505 [Betaproteobacteria bacterium]|nr:MAG: hypothetical protein E6H66_06505 [Betaproteobacteria bacterium]